MPDKDISSAFAKILRTKRTTVGFSQEKVAELAGIHPTHVGLIEREKRNPSLGVAQKICAALGVELSVVIKEAELASGRK